MKIELVNYKTHKALSLDLPSTGLVLLDGQSGAGKSSIMEAIAWCLTGEPKKGFYPWSGEKQTSVTIDTGGFVIRRTKSPEKLYVNGAEYDYESGQGALESRLGLSAAQFLLSAYIRQNMQDSLLTMGATEQQRVVQEAAFGAESPELFRERVKERLSDAEKIFSVNSARESAFQQSYENISDPGDGPTTEEVKKQISSCRLAMANIEGNLRQLAEAHLRHDNAKRLLTRQMEQKNAAAEEKTTLVEPASTEPPWQKYDQATCAAKQAELKSIIDAYARAEALGSFDENAEVSLLSARQRLQEASQRQAVLREQSKTAATELNCPHCSGRVFFEGGELHTEGHGSVDSELSEATLEVATLSAKVKELEVVANLSRQKAEAIERARAEQTLSLASAESNLQKLSAYLAKQKEQESQYVAYLSAKARHEEATGRLERVLAEPPVVVPLAPEPMMPFQERLVSLRSEDLSLAGQLAEAEGRAKARLAKSHAYQSLVSAKAAAAVAAEAVRDAGALLSIVDRAASAAIASVLSQINGAARKYLEHLFPDDAATVELCNVRVNKDETVRATMSVQIYYKNHIVSSMRDLSGGERARITLAFNLALAEMFGSPIVMVDEGLNGLQTELRDDCVTMLKEAALNRLVLVIQHGIDQGEFDSVHSL